MVGEKDSVARRRIFWPRNQPVKTVPGKRKYREKRVRFRYALVYAVKAEIFGGGWECRFRP